MHKHNTFGRICEGILVEMCFDICMLTCVNHTMDHGFELISRNLRAFRVKSLRFGLRYMLIFIWMQFTEGFVVLLCNAFVSGAFFSCSC